MMQIKGSEQEKCNLAVNSDSTSEALWQGISWKFCMNSEFIKNTNRETAQMM